MALYRYYACSEEPYSGDVEMKNHIEMHRYCDGAIYKFYLVEDGAATRYRREDKNIWILRHPQFGWIIWDDIDNTLMSRPWDTPINQQDDIPPQGDWVSKKDKNSFVYKLRYV
jgi:hypothetical protein